MTKKSFYSLLGLLVAILFMHSSCVSSKYLKGVTAAGQKVYLGEVPVENTEAYKTYLVSAQTEVHKQQYLFQRLKDAPKDLEYYHDGNWYNWLETYRGGMWLIRNRYQKGQDTRLFLKKYVLRSETSNELHLIRFPDGSVQVAYDVLLNELGMLEETVSVKKAA